MNAGDAESAAGLFDPDGIFLPPGQPALQGTSAIRAPVQSRICELSRQGVRSPNRLPPSSAATSRSKHGNWNATFQPKNGSPKLPVGGTYLTVYARLSDGRQPQRRTRSWAASIEKQRRGVAGILRENPSLRRYLQDTHFMSSAYDDGVLSAVIETNLDEATFPARCPYTFDQILKY